MAAHFLRLRLTAARNAHRRRPAALLGLLLWLAALTLGTITAVRILTDAATTQTIDGAPPALATTAMLLGSTLTLLCLVVPLVLGADDRNDPRQYATLGLTPNRVATGLAAATLASPTGLALTIIATAHAIAWGSHPDAVGFAIASIPLIVATGLLAIRVTTSLSALLLASRQARDIAALTTFASLVIIAPAAVLTAYSDWGPASLTDPVALTSILARTPLGAAWAAPADAAHGNPGAAWGSLGLALLYLAALALAWRVLVGILLVTPVRERAETGRNHLGWFDATTPTPAGVVGARSATYWGRDPRYRTSAAAVPVIPLVIVAALAIAGIPLTYLALIVVPIMCLFLGWSTTHNDLAHDHSALWLHIAAHTRGAHDRLGRLLPPLLIGIPLIAVGSPLTALLYGDLDAAWSVAAVSTATLLITLGISSVYSVTAPYPAAHPGNSAFEQPQTADTGAFGAQAGGFCSPCCSPPPPCSSPGKPPSATRSRTPRWCSSGPRAASSCSGSASGSAAASTTTGNPNCSPSPCATESAAARTRSTLPQWMRTGGRARQRAAS